MAAIAPNINGQGAERRPHRATLIHGDGIGPEVIEAARQVIEGAGVAMDWDVQIAGEVAYRDSGSPLPDDVLESIKDRGVGLKGPLNAPRAGYRSPNIELRKALGLRVGIRPCKAIAGVETPFPRTDLVVIRMLSEDLYAGIEFEPGGADTERLRKLIRGATGRSVPRDAGISIKALSRSAAEPVIRDAFEYAQRNGRSKVTVVHKANVMRQTDGVFLDVARAVGSDFPEISVEDGLVDAVCHRLVRDPGEYDVLVTTMLYGDVISDIGAGLIGGLGVAPGANMGEGCAVFEAVHGSALRHAGQGRANPIAAILSGSMLVRQLGETAAADRIEAAVAAVVREGRSLTYDLVLEGAEPAPTTTVAEAVVVELQEP